MKLTNEDLIAIQSLLRPLEDRILKLEERVNERFDTTDQNFDALFKRDETNQQEYSVISNQISRLEERVSSLEGEKH